MVGDPCCRRIDSEAEADLREGLRRQVVCWCSLTTKNLILADNRGYEDAASPVEHYLWDRLVSAACLDHAQAGAARSH
jgi:hypothetical protein